jgi:hypothetical protein
VFFHFPWHRFLALSGMARTSNNGMTMPLLSFKVGSMALRKYPQESAHPFNGALPLSAEANRMRTLSHKMLAQVKIKS